VEVGQLDGVWHELDGVVNSSAVVPAEEVDVEVGGGEEELVLGAPELGGGGCPHR